MRDVLDLAIAVAFFALTAWMVALFERLRRGR
jgi:hypothetical protein